MPRGVASPSSPFAGFLSTFVGVVLAGLLLVWLARPRLLGVWEKLRTAPASSLGHGALAFVGLLLAALLGALVLGLLAAVLTLLRLGNLGLPLALTGTPVLGALVTPGALLLSLGALWLTLRGPPRRPVMPQIGTPRAT